jgi:hypothetical protein
MLAAMKYAIFPMESPYPKPEFQAASPNIRSTSKPRSQTPSKMPSTTSVNAKDQLIDNSTIFHGFLSRDDVDSLLPNKGDYLLRKSETSTNQWNYVLSLRCHDDNKVGPTLFDCISRLSPKHLLHLQTLRHYVLHRENGVYQFRNDRPYRNPLVMIDAHRQNKWPLDKHVSTALLTKPITKESWEVSPFVFDSSPTCPSQSSRLPFSSTTRIFGAATPSARVSSATSSAALSTCVARL